MSSPKISIAEVRSALRGAFGQVVNAYSNGTTGRTELAKFQAGKLFEVYALANVLEAIKAIQPHCQLVPQNAPKGRFRIQGSPGHANPKSSYILLKDQHGNAVANIWNSVEFSGMSAIVTSSSSKQGSYHEADILIEAIPGRATSSSPYRPVANDLVAVFECKFVQQLSKNILRNQLGLRREMSLLVRGSGRLPRSRLFELLNAKQSKDKVFEEWLPASCGTQQPPLAPHVFLIYSTRLRPVDLNDVWENPAQMHGLEFWGIW